MFPLFELVRLFTVKDEYDSGESPSIVRYAYKEAGEINLLALACTNGYLLLRYSTYGKAPTTQQLPWPKEKPISSMCFDPTVSWLLVLTEDAMLFIIPVLSIMDPSSRVNQLWKDDDVTVTKVKKPKGLPAVVLWWHTLEDQQIAIIGTKAGELVFVDLLRRKVVNEMTVESKITQLDIVEDDQQMTTNLLITGQSGLQWRLLLESRTHEILSLPDKELLELGYDTVDGRVLPTISITQQTEQTRNLFLPLKFYQFQRSVCLSPQYAKGRHFIAAHCSKSSTYQIFDSDIEHLPLFVYKLPFGAYNVIMTDKVIFTTTRLGGEKKMLIIANQRAETSIDDEQDFNKDAVLQQFDLPQEERLLTVLKKSYPFYWHEKREEDLRQKWVQDVQLGLLRTARGTLIPNTAYDIQVTSHTVLDGCIVITGSSVYECRPRISPERLFLQLAVQQLDHSQTEMLGIGLGLDLNTLYELSAEHVLRNGDYPQAVRLYKLSKCSHTRRVANFAKYGCVSEVMCYLRQVVNSQTADINTSERKQLTDMAIHCFVHQILQLPCSERAVLQQTFLDFLITNFSYEEKSALSLLAEHGMLHILLELAKARGLVMEALELLVQNGYTRIEKSMVDSLVSKGFVSHLVQAANGAFLQAMSAEDKCQILCTKSELALQHFSILSDSVSELGEDFLFNLATIFDPSRSPLRSHIAKRMISKRRTPSLSSLNSQSSDGDPYITDSALPDAYLLLDFFITLLLQLNIQRDKSGSLPQSCDLTLTDTKDIQKQYFPTGNSLPPKRVRLPCRSSPIGAGSHHVALVRNGDVYTWGRTSHGRLGHGDLAPENTVSPPCRVETLHMLHVRVISVSCGGEHTMVLTQQGVFAWGSSQYGQVGVGTRHIYSRPMLLDSLSSTPCVSVECGQYHSLALSTDGEVYSWGWGVHGQLGVGNAEDYLSPVKVEILSDKQITRICAGYCHSLTLSAEGEVYAFGCGFFGQLGTGTNKKQSIPVKIQGLKERVLLINTKYFHNVAVTQSNRVFVWGCHPYNLRFAAHSVRKARQLGATITDPADRYLLPDQVDTSFVNGRINQVICGSSHSVLITIDGDVYTWGRNMDGQIGNNTRQEVKIPAMVTNINDRQVKFMASGGEFNIALDSDGLTWGWGKNDLGQLCQDKIDTPLTGSQGKVTKTQGRRRAGSGITEFLLPTVCQGLPTAKPSSSLWRTSSSLTKSGSYDSSDGDNWWTDETDDYHLALLPDLQSVGEPKYSRVILLQVLEHLSSLCNCTQILRRCVNMTDWLSAAYICLHQANYSQALAFHLKALSSYKEKFVSDFQQMSCTIVSKYLQLCVSQELPAAQKEENYRILLLQTLEHWEMHALPVTVLEDLLDSHLDNICCILTTFLFWETVTETDNNAVSSTKLTDGENKADQSIHARIGASDIFIRKFSTKFCLKLLQKVFEKMLLSDFEKKYPVSHSALQGLLSSHFDGNSDLDLQPSDKLIPFEQLWQDVVQNLQKGSDSKDYIYISRSELDHLSEKLSEQMALGSLSIQEEGNTQDTNVVVFTCGHHYTKRTFMDEIVVNFNKEVSQSPNSLPDSANLLVHYYGRQGLLPLACPKCVLNAIHASV